MLSLPSFLCVRQSSSALFVKTLLLKHTVTVKEVLPTLSLIILIPLSFTIREDISALYAAKCFLKKTFAMPGRRISKYTILHVMNMLKDPRVTFAMAAKEASVSVTTAEHIFDAHAGISSMPLPAILCMDEVYAVKYHQKVYACVLADFKSSQVYDLLPDRIKYTLAKYFSSISRDTRKTVKYVSMDMWDTYRDIASVYLPDAKICVDSFHVIKHLHSNFDRLRIDLMNQCEYGSNAYFLLKKWSWLLVSDNVNLDNNRLYNKRFHTRLNRRDLRDMLFGLMN